MANKDWYHWQPDGLLLRLQVQTRASDNKFAEILEDRIKLRIKAAAVDGKANKAVIHFLINNRPLIVLERVVFLHQLIGPVINFFADLRVLSAEAAGYFVAQLFQGELKTRRAGLVKSDAENFWFHWGSDAAESVREENRSGVLQHFLHTLNHGSCIVSVNKTMIER